MADDQIKVNPARKAFDIATVLGLLGAFALISAAIILGGSPKQFINLQSILIVFGGTFAVTTVCFSFGEMVRTLAAAGKSFVRTVRKPKDAAIQMLQLSYEARRNGILALQNYTGNLEAEPFLHKGISMLVDGSAVAEVSSVLQRDLIANVQRSSVAVKVLRRGAEFAPAMGLIGTLIGLVTMLGNLDDPSTIGPSMAVALLTTFYGALLANLVFLPLAAKLENNSNLEEAVGSMYLLGVSSIGRQENPRRLEMLLNSSLPPSDRVRFFDNE